MEFECSFWTIVKVQIQAMICRLLVLVQAGSYNACHVSTRFRHHLWQP